jgi:hypothetical protein
VDSGRHPKQAVRLNLNEHKIAESLIHGRTLILKSRKTALSETSFSATSCGHALKGFGMGQKNIENMSTETFEFSIGGHC